MRRAAIVVVLVVALAALGAAAWAAWAPLPPEPREVLYVIPTGTAARQARGEPVNVLPSRMRFTLGDVLVLRNEDDRSVSFGPAVLSAGQTYRVPLRVPIEFQLACSVHPAGAITIEVAPPPAPGWPRLRWRLGRVGLLYH
jgi:hypothetical protein